jgi:subtilisin family serine protease
MRALRVASLLTGLGIVTASLQSDRALAGWPPKPGDDLTNPANWPSDHGYKDNWNYFSYLHPQSPGTPPYTAADVKLGASGMSIDKAWTYTVGRPDVVIAEIDCGIEWESDDLVNKAWLNAKELAGTRRPQDKLGAACGGQGELAGYDCDADGVFSVADYRDDPRVAPAVAGEKCFVDGERTKLGPDRIKGDLNRNCILDPGDLIELFSDGVDDDGNGYVDDISGWDFFKNDNNAYDDTRYGHGTGEARDSSAEGNNAKGDIGVCPLCRFIPLRVADSYVADSNAYGKAVIYGVDNGVKVIQEALGGNLFGIARKPHTPGIRCATNLDIHSSPPGRNPLVC